MNFAAARTHNLNAPSCWLELAVGLFTLAYAVGEAAQGTGWPRFRGENGSGLSGATNLPTRWSDADVAWKADIPGRGHASPVVWGEAIFVFSGDDTSAERHLVCLRPGDGSRMWHKQFASERSPQNRENSFGSATPAVDAQGVYCYWTTPEAITLAALSLDGKERWVRTFEPYRARHGSGASVVLHEDLLWVNNDQEGPSSLLAVDKRSGEVRHRLPRRTDKASYGTPCVLEEAGKATQLIFAASGHGLTSVDPLKGTVNWDFTNLFPARIVSSPIVSDGLIICSSGEGGIGRRLVAVRPPAGNQGASVAYDLKRDIPNVPTPLVKDGRLYVLVDNGLLRCLKVQNGATVWQERLPARFYASPIYADGRLYLISKTGDVFVVACGDKYELLGQNSLGEPSFATPAAVGQSLYFRTEAHLFAVRKPK